MLTRIVLAITAMTIFSAASAQERDIYSALNTVAASPDGVAIAQGLVEVGNALTAMNVDQTIAFRTSLTLLIASGQVQNGTAEREMVNVLGRATALHLLTLCSVDRSAETVVKVNLELGRPYRCQTE